jgi:FtsH-binding integral membrane protein
VDDEVPPGGERAPVIVVTVVWAVLFLAGLAEHDRLEAAGRGWWVWTAVAGIVLGFVGLAYVARHQRRRRR